MSLTEEKIVDIAITKEMVDVGMMFITRIEWEGGGDDPDEMLKKAFTAMLSIYESNLERDAKKPGLPQPQSPGSPEK